jgi:hypothetical protein
VYLSIVDMVKFIGIVMYNFKISFVGESVKVSTSMLYSISPRMALESMGFFVKESCFEKGDITFTYYPSIDKTVNINVWKGDEIIHSIRNADYIDLLVFSNGCICLIAPDYKVTIQC